MVDLKRTLMQMKYSGWFDNCAGILFGRSPMNDDQADYSYLHVYQELAQDLGIPILYDIDCGHLPPQITFINGAWATVTYENGKATVTQDFK